MRRTLPELLATLFAAAPRQVAALTAAMLALAASEGAGLVLLAPLLQAIGVDSGGEASRVGGAVADRLRQWGVEPTLGLMLGAFVGIAVAQSALQRVHTVLSSAVQYDVTSVLRRRAYDAIARADWLFVARARQSELAFVLTHLVDRVGTVCYYLMELAVAAVVALVYVAVAFAISARLTLLVLICGASAAWLLRHRLRQSRQTGEQVSAAWARLYRAIADHLGSMKTARSYDCDRQHAEAFSALANEVQRVNLTTVSDQARLRQQTVVASAVTLAVVVYLSRALLGLPASQMLVMLFLFGRLMPRLTGLVERTQSVVALLPAYELVRDTERRCRDAAEPPATDVAAFNWTNEVRFDRVTFSYGGTTDALRNVDLVIQSGSTTAIVGASGAGKSTIADLMLGLVTPTAGAIRLDGRELTPALLRSWRRQVGYVTQETFLFHDTVRANLSWAAPGATESDLRRALRLAAADDFVAQLPDGLDTVLGDRATLVSGGERQRLALARALVRQPKLLILDEATSALDSENERRIQHAIDGLQHRMTVVVITHRLSMIRGADVIYVLDDGRVDAHGTWDQLWHRGNGTFARLCRAQGLSEPAAAAPLVAS